MRDRPLRTLGFAAAVCTVCALAVSTFAVRLRPRIESNRALDRQLKVLIAAGLFAAGDRPRRGELEARFRELVTPRIVKLRTGELLASGAEARARLEETRAAPENAAGLVRVPTHVEVYFVGGGAVAPVIVLPVEGKGLWSTIRGFLALDAVEPARVRGVEFYEHGETPGLGGEIDNPRWKARWRGRLALNEAGTPVLHVARRAAGPPAIDPHSIDALSGATITGRGVTALVQYWLGPEGYGPLLERLRRGGGPP